MLEHTHAHTHILYFTQECTELMLGVEQTDLHSLFSAVKVKKLYFKHLFEAEVEV